MSTGAADDNRRSWTPFSTTLLFDVVTGFPTIPLDHRCIDKAASSSIAKSLLQHPIDIDIDELAVEKQWLFEGPVLGYAVRPMPRTVCCVQHPHNHCTPAPFAIIGSIHNPPHRAPNDLDLYGPIRFLTDPAKLRLPPLPVAEPDRRRFDLADSVQAGMTTRIPLEAIEQCGPFFTCRRPLDMPDTPAQVKGGDDDESLDAAPPHFLSLNPARLFFYFPVLFVTSG